jgi:hypothetical protein
MSIFRSGGLCRHLQVSHRSFSLDVIKDVPKGGALILRKYN